MILILSRKFSLYITSPRTLTILKDPSFAKFNLSLSLMVWINIILIFNILYRRYTLFLSLRVSLQTFFLLANSFIFLLKKVKFCQSLFYNLWISFTLITICGINSSHFFIFNKILALNPLFIKNRVLLVVLYFKVLYASIPMGNNLT